MDQAGEERWLEERLDRALARQPHLTIPEEFTARVMATLPQPHTTAPTRYSRVAVLLCGALLMLALIWLSAGWAREPRWLISLLSIELAVVALGAGSWRRVLGWPT